MTDRLIITGGSDGLVGVSYRPDDAEACGAPVSFVSPRSGDDLADLTWYLEKYLSAPCALYAKKGAAIEGKLKDWGEALFDAVFASGPPRDAYQRARGSQAELVIRSEAAAFLALPWELIKDPDRPSPLALDLRGISRSCELTGSLIGVPPGEALQGLMVISRPAGLKDMSFPHKTGPLLWPREGDWAWATAFFVGSTMRMGTAVGT